MDMTPPDIRTAMRGYIVDNFLMGAELAIGDGDSFLEHHVVDSTGFLELIAFMEERWGIVVADDEMLPENLDSLECIDAYVRRKLAA